MPWPFPKEDVDVFEKPPPQSSQRKISHTHPDQEYDQRDQAGTGLGDGGVVPLTDVRDVLGEIDNLPRDVAGLRQLTHLIAKGGQDVGAPARRAKDHLEAAALGDDERTGLVVVRVAVRVRADLLGLGGIQAG